MIWYLVAFICGLSAFAECARHNQPVMAVIMLTGSMVSLFGALTS